ncbi:hypothetical protein G9A89_003418 [Geosiphon pyriformis]|nr:hypothetical protein G9A89_003418 [Geosiphon pyriformis]
MSNIFRFNKTYALNSRNFDTNLKVRVTDEEELALLAQHAFYAYYAACLDSKEDKFVTDLYAKFVIKAEKRKKKEPETRIVYFNTPEHYEGKIHTLVPFRGNMFAGVDKEYHDVWLRLHLNKFKTFWQKVYDIHSQNPKMGIPGKKCYFEFTGFGIAGVQAVFAGLAYAKKYKQKPIVVTFGQPKMGDFYFAYEVYLNVRLYRVTYGKDYVPGFPLNVPEYWPLSTEYWIPQQNQCECFVDDPVAKRSFPEVYKCEQRGTKDLNKLCNAQFHRQVNVPQYMADNHYHSGPYFGYYMGLCPN